MAKIVKTAIDTRTFREIWESWDSFERGLFYEKAKGLKDSAIRSYGTGRRKASSPSMKCLIDGFRRMGMNVGDGRYLFR